MKVKEQNVPVLRFPGFDEDWKTEDLKDIAGIYDGTHQTPKYKKRGVRFVSVENINDINAAGKYISKEAFEKDFKTKPQKNDILMTRITAGIIGATAVVRNNDPLGYYVSLALIRKKDPAINTEFLNYRINSELFKHELHKRIIHVAFPKKINLGEIGRCKVSTTSLPEQQKIASFLTAVDSKIEQLSKKKALLEQYKKGMMQKLFPAKDETVPELRFPGFSGEWQKSIISDFAKVTTGNKDTQDKIDHGGYPFFVRSQTIERINSYSYNGEAILTSGDGVGVGKNFHYIIGKFDFHQRVYCIYGFSKDVYGFFIFQYFSKHFYKRVMKLSAKNSVDSIRMAMITEMPIRLPCLKEQQKIATFLSSIDKKINLISTELNQAQSFKKGLLQQMFI